MGLLILRLKVARQRSVAGISAKTVTMYALVFTLRFFLLMPSPGSDSLNAAALEALQLPSLLVVFDVLRSFRGPYKGTYQEDLDKLNVRRIIPGCLIFAFLLHADLDDGYW